MSRNVLERPHPTPQDAPAPPAAPAGPPKRGLRSRLSVGHIVMVLAGVTSAALVASALSDERSGLIETVVITEAVAAGEPVPEGSLAIVEADIAEQQASALLPSAQIGEVEGWIAASALTAGQFISEGDLRNPGTNSEFRAFSFPVPASLAVGGRLSAGDRIDIINAIDGASVYITTNTEVLVVSGAAGDSGGPLGAESGEFVVTVAVDAATALRLADAITSGSLVVSRSTGSDPATDVAPYRRGEDPAYPASSSAPGTGADTTPATPDDTDGTEGADGTGEAPPPPAAEEVPLDPVTGNSTVVDPDEG